MTRASETFRVRARGDLACFTRPEFKVERVSYEAMTPSAARGILEAIHWKPAICWVVTAIQVLKPVRFISFKRNEVTRRASVDTALQGLKGQAVEPYFADEDRAQRNTVALRDVDYVIEAHFVPAAGWRPEDNYAKHAEMFTRRLASGQTFHQPYLGCREFAAAVEPVAGELACELPAEWRNRDLGWMLHDLAFGPGSCRGSSRRRSTRTASSRSRRSRRQPLRTASGWEAGHDPGGPEGTGGAGGAGKQP
jgi:CRISPR-associated protein Cas5d